MSIQSLAQPASVGIGPLTERIVIQTATPSTDTQGGRSVSWGTLDTVWAEYVPLSVGERLQAASSLGSELDIRFRVRRRLDVTAQMRVSWTPTFPPSAAARAFEIRGVVPVGDGRTWMHLECSEVS